MSWEPLVNANHAQCNFNFATFAVVYGSLIIVYAGLTLIAAVTIANNHESGFGKNLDRFNRSLLAPCIGGVFIWGTGAMLVPRHVRGLASVTPVTLRSARLLQQPVE